MNKYNRALIEANKKGYYVDKLGNVYSPNKKLVLRTNKHGRKHFSIKYNGERINIFVYRFIAYLKFGNRMFSENTDVKHLNCNPSDDSWDNIDIGTYEENKHNTLKDVRKKRATHASSKNRRFTKNDVENILKDRKEGFTYKQLCEKYNTSKSTLSYLFNNAQYSKIG